MFDNWIVIDERTSEAEYAQDIAHALYLAQIPDYSGAKLWFNDAASVWEHFMSKRDRRDATALYFDDELNRRHDYERCSCLSCSQVRILSVALMAQKPGG